jgi:hypothetical protein
LQGYKGRLVTLGADPLAYNEYGRPRQTSLAADSIEYVPGKTYASDLWKSLLSRLPNWNISPHITLTDADGKPVWGVEYKEAITADGTLINICNYLNSPVEVKLSGKKQTVIDVLTHEITQDSMKLKSLEVRLLKVNN